MIRWGMFAAGAAVIAGAAFVTGTSIPPKPFAEPHKVETKTLATIGQRTGYFNMARLMREYKRSNAHIATINERHQRVLANLNGMRAMHVALQARLQATKNEDEKHTIGRELVMLGRIIEDYERDHVKTHQERSAEIIAELYHEIQDTVADVSRAHGLSAMLAYPAPVSPREAENPAIMELTLKPPAAYPFYLDPAVDYTDELLQRLNAKFAADGDK